MAVNFPNVFYIRFSVIAKDGNILVKRFGVFASRCRIYMPGNPFLKRKLCSQHVKFQAHKLVSPAQAFLQIVGQLIHIHLPTGLALGVKKEVCPSRMLEECLHRCWHGDIFHHLLPGIRLKQQLFYFLFHQRTRPKPQFVHRFMF